MAQAKAGSDMGAAFTGLILGATFIGAIMYGIVVWTNKHFEAEKAAHATTKTGAMVTPVASRFLLG